MSSAGRERNPKRVGVPIVAALAIALLLPSGASAANSLAVHGSVNQVYVTGAQPGTSLPPDPQGQDGPQEARRVPGRRSLPRGRRRQGLPGPRRRRLPLGPRRGDERPIGAEGPSIYNQTLPAGGYGYLTRGTGPALRST